MGNSASANGATDGSADFVVERFAGAYAGACDTCGSGMVSGGGAASAFTGGLDTVVNYVNSAQSGAKSHIIKTILEAAKTLGLTPTGETDALKVKSLLDKMPKPEQIRQDPEVHKRTCTNIARAINAAYGSPIVNMDVSLELICQQVVEIMSSLVASMHTEFIAVYSDVRKVLENMQSLESFLKENQKQIKEKISESTDTNVVRGLTRNYDVNDSIAQENSRQLSILRNLLNIHLAPSARDLASLLKKKQDITGYIKKIKIKPGESSMGRVISDMLNGLGITANFAIAVNQALTEVGLTMEDFKNMKNASDLNASIIKNIPIDQNDRHKFNIALDFLRDNLYKREEIGAVKGSMESYDYGNTNSGSVGDLAHAAITQQQGGAASMVGDVFGDGVFDGGSASMVGDVFGTDMYGMYGGAETYEASKLDKRVEANKKLKNLVFSTFNRELNQIMDRLVGALDTLSTKVGTEIPISDQLDGFRQALTRAQSSFAMSRKQEIYFALIGYYNDAQSKSKRDQIIGEFRMISSFIESMMLNQLYAGSIGYFQAVQAQIKSFIDLCSKYTEEVSAKFGRGERATTHTVGAVADFSIAAVTPGMASGALGDGTLSALAHGAAEYLPVGDVLGASPFSGATAFAGVHGGFDGDGDDDVDANKTGGAADVEPVRFRTGKSLDVAIQKFDYMYRVAQIRGNLARAGKELPHYGEKYEKLVANSIADILRKDMDVFKALRKRLIADNTAIADVSSEEKQAALEFLDSQWETKKKFWATIEAVDMYMKAFTDGFVNNPNDIKDIRSALDDIEIIRDWYSSNSGNFLAAAFEQFGTEPVDKDGKTTESGIKTDNYYSELGAGGKPATPYNVTTAKRGCDAKNNVKRMLTTMMALKNLMSVFVHMGGKFGGTELSSKVFMTPAQIYNNLVEYLQASAFTQSFELAKEFTTGKAIDDSNWAKDNGVNGAVYTQGLTSKGVGMKAVAEGAAAAVATALGAAATDVQKADAAAKDAKRGYVKHWGVRMRSVKAVLRATEGEEDSSGAINFLREDDYFVLILKSLGAKILTVTGMYDVFDRPHEKNDLMKPIRMIMGGSVETPKVDENAVALYLRLPLLCEFWREIFGFDKGTEGAYDFEDYKSYPTTANADGKKMMKISMVPDVDGVFAGLIKLMFRSNKFMRTGTFTDDDLKDVIRECNLIYQRMLSKYPQNTVMETIHELVAEVNRRYGVISMAERETYQLEIFGQDTSYGTAGVTDRYGQEAELPEIALLPGEEDMQIQRPSAAERLLGTGYDSTPSDLTSKYSIVKAHRELVWKFRCAIDKYFESPGTKYSFSRAIHSVQQKLKRETRDEERFKIVAGLVRGVDVYSQIDGMKYIMFHESVVTGLNALSGMHTLLSRFQSRVQMVDLQWHMQTFAKWVDEGKKVPTTPLTHTNWKKYVAKELEAQKVYHDKDVIEIEKFVARIYPNTIVAAPGVVATELRFSIDVNADGNIKATPGSKMFGELLTGITVTDLEKYPRKCEQGDAKQQKIACFFRYLVDQKFVMREIVESVYGLAQDAQSLVSVRLDSEQLFLNVGNLKSTIKDMFDQVSRFVDALRPHVSASMIAKYTGKLNTGSLYYLQEQLMEKIIVGRTTNDNGTAYWNLDQLGIKLSRSYNLLVREYKFNGGGIANGTVAVDKPSRNAFGDLFAELVYYNGKVSNSGIHGSTKASKDAGPRIVDYMTNDYDRLFLSGVPGSTGGAQQILDTRFASRFYQLYTWEKEFTLNRSALFAFNQLVAKFIQGFYDTAESKIYTGLINKFANGVFANSLKDLRYTYPDVGAMAVVKKGPAGTLSAPPVMNIEYDLNAPIETLITFLKTKRNNTEIIKKQDIKDSTNKFTALIATGVNAISVAADSLNPPSVTGNDLPLRNAIRLFPFDDFIASSESESDNRIRLFVRLWASLATTMNPPKAPSKRTLSDVKLDPTSVYTPGAQTATAHIIPYEKITLVNSAHFNKAVIPNDLGEEIVMFLARKDAIDGIADEDSWKQLKIDSDVGTKDIADIDQFGKRMDPDGDHVLFTSLAVILKNITTTRTTTGHHYLADGINDLPLYMKERMRANLPQFRNLFKELTSRCELLKQFANRREMNLERDLTTPPTQNPWPFVLNKLEKDSNPNQVRMSGILDTIIRGCQSMQSACEQTLKEVGDEPKYLECYQNSIRDYKTHNGSEPLMPVSTMLHVLTNVTAANELDFFPVHMSGESKFKLAYGMRGLISGQEPTRENVPGWASTVNEFNLMVDNRLQLDDAVSAAYLKTLVSTVRFIHGSKHVKGLLTPYVSDDSAAHAGGATPVAPTHLSGGAFNRGNMLLDKDGIEKGKNKTNASLLSGSDYDKTSPDYAGVHLKPVFVLGKNYDQAIMLTESSIKNDKIRELVDYIFSGKDSNEPKSLAVQNIVDLNIVPINVHALMRDIPLANLYNYAYTFDRLVIELYGGRNGEEVGDMIKELCGRDCTEKEASGLVKINSSKEMLIALLLDPYLDLDKVYGGQTRSNMSLYEYVEQIMLGGVAGESIGRPKFLSDEMYGKALLGSLYKTAITNELGPGADHMRKITRDTAFKLYFDNLNKLIAVDNDKNGGKKFKIDLSAANMNIKYADIARYIMDNQRASAKQIYEFVLGLNITGMDDASARGFAVLILASSISTTMSISTPSFNDAAFKVFVDSIDVDTTGNVTTSDANVNNLFDGFTTDNTVVVNGVKSAATLEPTAELYKMEPRSATSARMVNKPSAGGDLTLRDIDNKNTYKVHKDAGLVSHMRFDTILARNLTFIVNLYRTIRIKLHEDLDYDKDIITRSIPITRYSQTEFAGNNKRGDRKNHLDEYDGE
tara:strand:- start:87411 stop:95927 length:8517 start_codon:yes stop_codon:yes gene_type:complete